MQGGEGAKERGGVKEGGGGVKGEGGVEGGRGEKGKGMIRVTLKREQRIRSISRK